MYCPARVAMETARAGRLVMEMFFLVPVEQVGNKRTPRYVRSWNIRDGLLANWSWKDFGRDSSVGLLITDIALNQPDTFEIDPAGAWTIKNRDDLDAYIKAAGIQDLGWIKDAANEREGLHRVAGMALAVQSAVDDPHTDSRKQDPSEWLKRDVHCGALGKIDAYDKQGARLLAARNALENWRLEGRTWRNIVTGDEIPVMVVRDTFGGGGGGFGLRSLWRGIALAPLMILMGALPYLEPFTNADLTLLETHSANWTENDGGGSLSFRTHTNGVIVDSSLADVAAHINSETFSNDQYAQLVISAITSGTYIGPAVRCASGETMTWGGLYGDSADGSYLAKMVASVWTQMGSMGAVFSVSNVAKLEVSGTTWTPKIGGSTLNPPGAQTDSSISSGYAGITGYNASLNTRGDDFEGGNLGGAATSLLMDDRRRRFQNLLVR